MTRFIFYILRALNISAILGMFILSAQTRHMIVVDVPFDFNVLDRHLPAGTYTLTSETPNSAILIRNEKDGAAMFALAFSAQTASVRNEPRLVFHQYGDQYFLRDIWYSGTDQGRELKVSKVEQLVARSMPKSGEATLLASRSKAPRTPR